MEGAKWRVGGNEIGGERRTGWGVRSQAGTVVIVRTSDYPLKETGRRLETLSWV